MSTELLDAIDKHFERVMNDKEHPPSEVLRIHYGNRVGDRTGSVIVASIKTASMTLNEMGLILGAITDRICQVMREYPELEETAHDLAQTCESYAEAQDKIDERLYRNDHDARAAE